MTTQSPLANLNATARIALQCLDLTSLNDKDTAADIEALCQRAQTPYGAVAAVCVWPRFVALARSLLPDSVPVAAVANFPTGALDMQSALSDCEQIIQAGGNEVDVVLPYRALMAGQVAECADFLANVRAACASVTLKVIIESGELKTPELIAQASRLALDAGADFIKTSTGKTPISATPEAAQTMLREIVAHSHTAGFKASGGIRSVVDAQLYLGLVADALGPDALTPQRFRFGASGLLNDIENVLAGQASAAVNSAY